MGNIYEFTVSDFYKDAFDDLGYSIDDRYNVYYFDGYSYVENYKFETLGTTVYVLKEIDK